MKTRTSKLFALLLIVCLGVTQLTIGASAEEQPAKVLLKAIVNNMGDDKLVTNEMYSGLFGEDTTAEAGVLAVVGDGNFYINGIAVPKDADGLSTSYPNGYKVNSNTWLTAGDSVWYGPDGTRTAFDTYNAAALALINRIPAGLEVRLYDTDNDDEVDEIYMDYFEAMIIGSITKNQDGSYKVVRDPVSSLADNNDDDGTAGRVFDGNNFTETSEEIVRAANFDSDLKVGDMALFWLGSDGWHIDKPVAKTGSFVYGEDHGYYQIDSIKYPDAMRFSRDNIVISNRCGEYWNAHNYFGLTGEGSTAITLWLVPTTDGVGAPAGFTSNSVSDAKAFLTSAIEQAKEKLKAVVVSEDGAKVEAGKFWVTSAVYNQLDTAIKLAEQVLNTSTSSAAELDYQVYLLYLTLHGSNDDIGAKFAGYTYAGFDNLTTAGTADGTNPGTGVETHLGVWLALCGVSLLAVAGLVAVQVRRKGK